MLNAMMLYVALWEKFLKTLGNTATQGYENQHFPLSFLPWLCVCGSYSTARDYHTETGHFPVTRIIELFEILDVSRAIIMLYPTQIQGSICIVGRREHTGRETVWGASSLCWLGRSRGKHGNCRGHSAVKWNTRREPASHIPQVSEHAPFDLYGETHWQYIQLA